MRKLVEQALAQQKEQLTHEYDNILNDKLRGTVRDAGRQRGHGATGRGDGARTRSSACCAYVDGDDDDDELSRLCMLLLMSVFMSICIPPLEQFENFSSFNRDYISRQLSKNDFSYLS